MRTAPVLSSAGRSRRSRRRAPIVAARPEATRVPSRRGSPAIWLLLLVAIGAVVGSLTCADSVAAGSHHGTAAIAAQPPGSDADQSPHSAAHGPHHSAAGSFARTPASVPEPSSESEAVGGHAGLPCVAAIDLRCEPVSAKVLAGPPIVAEVSRASDRLSPPDPPVPRSCRVHAS